MKHPAQQFGRKQLYIYTYCSLIRFDIKKIVIVDPKDADFSAVQGDKK
jgi:hypothetical protein